MYAPPTATQLAEDDKAALKTWLSDTRCLQHWQLRSIVEDVERLHGNVFANRGTSAPYEVYSHCNSEANWRKSDEIDFATRLAEHRSCDTHYLDVIIVEQEFSDDRLSISLEKFVHVAQLFETAPAIWDVTREFGKHCNPQRCVRFASTAHSSDNIMSSSYLLHYEDPSPEQGKPYKHRFRKTGVHHQCHKATDRHTFFLFHPSRWLKERLRDMPSSKEKPANWRAIEHAIFQSAEIHWRSSIDDMQAHTGDKQMLLGNAKDASDPAGAGLTTIRQADLQQAVSQTSLLDLRKQGLEFNIRILQQVKSCHYPEFVPRNELEAAQKAAQKRPELTVDAFRTIINFNSSERLNSLQNQLLDLQEYGKDSADRISRISFITVCYLPANFVATVFGTQYFHYDPKGTRWKAQVEDEWFMMFIGTVIITILSFVAWYLVIPLILHEEKWVKKGISKVSKAISEEVKRYGWRWWWPKRQVPSASGQAHEELPRRTIAEHFMVPQWVIAGTWEYVAGPLRRK